MAKTLKAGDSFGELALLTNRKRMATIICMSEKCELATLDKGNFNLILRTSEDYRLKLQMGHFSNQPIF